MPYISLYRKYRSQTFEDVMGQDHVTRTLQNAIRSGKISHAYLFCGSRGTGKTTVARLLAKALNCEQGPTPMPCNECEPCRNITDGHAVDVIELDAASNRSVDDIDALRDGVKYPPMRLRYKVYVIDEAHQLSSTAKDAFLKTLEEPPPHAVFVLATTEAHAIPLTIRSRCQQFDFRRGSVADIVERLRYVLQNEGREADDDALDVLARSAQGSWRDALSLLEQVLAYTDERLAAEHVNTVLGTVGDDVLYEVSDVLARADAAAAFDLAARLVHEGKDVRELVDAIANHFRDLLVAKVDPKSANLRAVERARQFTQERLLSLVEVFAAAGRDLRWSDEQRLILEMALLRSISAAAPAEPAAAPAAPPAETRTPPPPRPPVRPVEQPKHPPAPEPPAVPADGDLTLEQVQAAWPRVLKHVKDVQKKINVQALLREAHVVSIDGSTIVLGFDPRFKFHVESLQSAANNEIVARALEAVYGRKLRAKPVVSQPIEPQPQMPVEVEAESAPPPGGPAGLLDQVLDTFGGTVVDDLDSENYNPWKE